MAMTYRCDLCWDEFDTEQELREHVAREDDQLYDLGIGKCS